MSELPPTSEELQAAAALAAALDARDPLGGADSELAIAQLIRHSRGADGLDELAARRSRMRRLVVAISAVAATLLVVVGAALHFRTHAPQVPIAVAQARAIAEHDPSQVDAPMHDVRAKLLALALAAAPDPRASWLSRARAAHALADRDPQHARSELAAFVASRPPPQLDAAFARALRQDAWFRMGELDLTSDPRTSLEDAAAGVALGTADDLYFANLLILRARAHELLHDDRAAVADYQAALRINEAMLAKEVGR